MKGDLRIRAQTTHDGSSLLVRRARIREARTAGGYARIRVALDDPPSMAAPGQFFMVRLPWGPALPRALSPLTAAADEMEFFLKAEGILRGALAGLPPGSPVEMRGPYGVPYAERIARRRRYVLVGGGSGIAPLLHFATMYPEQVAATAFGFRLRAAQALIPEVNSASEDEAGETAEMRLSARWRPGLGIIACGPEPLLASVARRFGELPDVYVSLETRLGCGFGACLSCSIRTTSGLRRVCVDGPLFRCSEILWLN